MTCQLDIEKATKLCEVISRSQYCYLSNYDQFFELSTIVERLQDTVEFINTCELPMSKKQFNATDFICWLNFADLIINCLMSLDRIFVVPNNSTLFAYGKTKCYCDVEKNKSRHLGKYYSGVSDGTDDEFFKYLRSMVLAHSLKIDQEKFVKYSGSRYTYTPLVRWNNSKDSVDISYCVPDYRDKHRTLHIAILDLFEYLKDRYNYLDIIFSFIEKSKNTERKTLQKRYRTAFSNIPTELRPKYDLLWNTYKRLGNINVQNNADLLSTYLLQSKELMDFSFSTNARQISIFYEILNEILNIEIKDLISQTSNDFVISIFYHGDSNTKKGGVFPEYSYEVGKIVNDYENLLSSGEYYFNILFEEAQKHVVRYVSIDSDMGNREKAYLCIIAYCFDNVLHDCSLSKKLPRILVEKLGEMYEIQL